MRIVFRLALDQTKRLNIFDAVRKMILASGLAMEPAKVNPHWPRFAYGPAAARDVRAEREYVDIYLRKRYSREEVTHALMQAAPEGLEILQVTRVPYPLPSVQNLAAAVRYRVKGDFSSWINSGRSIENWMQAGKVAVILRSENGMVYQKDITPFLLEAKTVSPQEVTFTLAEIEGQHISPQWVIAAWWGREVLPQTDVFAGEDIIFIRQEICWRDSQGTLYAI